jgi:hypothetical protein
MSGGMSERPYAALLYWSSSAQRKPAVDCVGIQLLCVVEGEKWGK